MAERPVFVPCTNGDQLVEELSFEFDWSPGFARVQKKKNVAALHAAAAERGYAPLLEVSTKSDERLGQRLSAFSLKVLSQSLGEIPLECAFQGSKVFENGGPFTDLYSCDSRTAKKDPRIRSSGRLVAFKFDGIPFPTEPKTAFYDWLYISALFPHREFLRRLEKYVGFTDIEFNPARSLNCQARSCATFVAMQKRQILEEAVRSPAQFIAAMGPDLPPQRHSSKDAAAESELFDSDSSRGVAVEQSGPTENFQFSAQGIPQWFSPRHAGEKFKELCMELALLAADADKAKKKSLAKRLWEVQEAAEKYARYYFCNSPVQSVRIMQPSGAIYVILADGREVVVPQK